MWYLGIDLHLKQMTVSLRNENGDVILRQVSTRWAKLEEFRGQLQQAGAAGEKFIAIVEVCGFHDWLVKWLQQDDGSHMVLVVQPLGRSAAKTDRRDANDLSELLWVNRERLLRGDRVQGVRTVLVPGSGEQADRHLTQLRERLVWKRTQSINQIHKILRRHNLEWERPTKSFQTRKVTEWLKTLPRVRDGPFDLGPVARAVGAVGRAAPDNGRPYCGTISRQPECAVAGDDARREHVHRPGDRLPDCSHRAVSPWAEPGQFPRPDSGQQQFRRHETIGLDHQGR